MSRPWGKQHAPMLHHPKYVRASIEERAAWHTLFLYALNQTGEGVLGTAEDVEAMLRMYGHADPPAILAGLVKLRLLDRKGQVYSMHDWADHQPKDPTGKDRKAAQRDRERDGGSQLPLAETPATPTPTHPVVEAITKDDDVFALIQWVEQTTRRSWPARPGQRAVEVLIDLVKTHGRAAVEAAFATVAAAGDAHRPEQIVYPAQRILEPIPTGSPRKTPRLDKPGGQSYDDLLH